jgi:hypothetical protein
MLSKTLFR